MKDPSSSSLKVPPQAARKALEILAPGADLDALRFRRVSGGCIHPAVHVRVGAAGPEAFLKWGSPPDAPFLVEAEGLKALLERGGLRVPGVLGVGDHWLLLEYLPPTSPGPDTDVSLGSGLARLHRPLAPSATGESAHRPDRTPAPAPPGWDRDGWIGSLPQRNTGGPGRWPDFWRELRLEPQIARAHPRLPSSLRRSLERLQSRMEEALAGWEEDGLSLLHGDLWSGNVLVTGKGEPALVDPAAYRGHREVDLAMMELFGGFGGDVFAAYREARPLVPGYPRPRRDVYQLYPLLVHLNLFGEGYLGGVEQAVEEALATLG